MNDALLRLARDLKEKEIAYSVIGGVALNQHGFRRFTCDINILLTREGQAKFIDELAADGYRPAFPGATNKFRSTEQNVPIEIITSGEYPGDGKPKAIVFPDPGECSIEIDGICTVTLEKLVELKLASGMTGLGRRKDLADVQELIRVLSLNASFAERLDASVRDMYRELHHELEMAREQELDWDSSF